MGVAIVVYLDGCVLDVSINFFRISFAQYRMQRMPSSCYGSMGGLCLLHCEWFLDVVCALVMM